MLAPPPGRVDAFRAKNVLFHAWLRLVFDGDNTFAVRPLAHDGDVLPSLADWDKAQQKQVQEKVGRFATWDFRRHLLYFRNPTQFPGKKGPELYGPTSQMHVYYALCAFSANPHEASAFLAGLPVGAEDPGVTYLLTTPTEL
jgi:hypothetical protein